MDTREFCERAGAVLGGRGWMRKLSEITGKDYSTVKRWASGQLEVPPYASFLIVLLEVVPESRLPEDLLKILAPRR
jgi:hypothetical protein